MRPVGGWAIGAVLGAMAGLMIATFGAPMLLQSVAFIGLAFLALRSLALLSGSLVGVGATWLAVLVRAELACRSFDAEPNRGCSSFGVEPFYVISMSVLGIGVLLAVVAWRRRSGSPLSR